MRKFNYILICLMGVSWHIQCGKKSEQQVLSEKQFIQVYCDVVTYSDFIDETMREAFVDSVFKSYHITHQEFQNTVAAYSKDKKKWESIFTKIVEELERREKEWEVRKDSTIINN